MCFGTVSKGMVLFEDVITQIRYKNLYFLFCFAAREEGSEAAGEILFSEFFFVSANTHNYCFLPWFFFLFVSRIEEMFMNVF